MWKTKQLTSLWGTRQGTGCRRLSARVLVCDLKTHNKICFCFSTYRTQRAPVQHPTKQTWKLRKVKSQTTPPNHTSPCGGAWSRLDPNFGKKIKNTNILTHFWAILYENPYIDMLGGGYRYSKPFTQVFTTGKKHFEWKIGRTKGSGCEIQIKKREKRKKTAYMGYMGVTTSIRAPFYPTHPRPTLAYQYL